MCVGLSGFASVDKCLCNVCGGWIIVHIEDRCICICYGPSHSFWQALNVCVQVVCIEVYCTAQLHLCVSVCRPNLQNRVWIKERTEMSEKKVMMYAAAWIWCKIGNVCLLLSLWDANMNAFIFLKFLWADVCICVSISNRCVQVSAWARCEYILCMQVQGRCLRVSRRVRECRRRLCALVPNLSARDRCGCACARVSVWDRCLLSPVSNPRQECWARQTLIKINTPPLCKKHGEARAADAGKSSSGIFLPGITGEAERGRQRKPRAAHSIKITRGPKKKIH